MGEAIMTPVICCPYCIVAGYGFMSMIRNTRNEHICPRCGHVACPETPGFRCSCLRCLSMEDVSKARAG